MKTTTATETAAARSSDYLNGYEWEESEPPCLLNRRLINSVYIHSQIPSLSPNYLISLTRGYFMLINNKIIFFINFRTLFRHQ